MPRGIIFPILTKLYEVVILTHDTNEETGSMKLKLAEGHAIYW